MGKIKYIGKIRKFFDESYIVDINSLKRIFPKKDKRYLNLLISNLIKRGEIKQITRGLYTKHDDPSLAVFGFKPSYLGLQDALSIHNLWEQETIPIIITTKRARTGLRKVFGINVKIRKINNKYFFGFEHMKVGDFYLPVSDIEKTFIDMIYFNQKLDKEVLLKIKKKIYPEKLEKYLKKYPPKFRAKIKRIKV